MSFVGHKPISQVVNFEYRTPILHDPAASMEERYNWNEFRLQMRLAHLLFTTHKSLDVFSSKVSPSALKEARKFASKTSFISKSWQHLMKSTDSNTTPLPLFPSRDHAYNLRSKAVRFSSPEDEARQMVAAMKIQHAFHKFETRKMMAAAARIQHTYRSWKLRREFLHMRRQAIKIQAAFRGFQVHKQYRKIIWSVGVLEKAILRWRLKRKGFRGLQVNPVEDMKDEEQESDGEEDFFKISRKQAEERVERSVERIQAMFCSKKVQQEYSRTKMAHSQAKLELELEELINSDVDMLAAKTS